VARLLTRLLLLLVCAFAALSSSAAAALGLEEERIVLFTGLLVLLLLLPFLVRPALRQPSGPLVLLCILLAGIVLVNAAGGGLDPIDAKVTLPVLVLLAAPNLARHYGADELVRLVWLLLGAYVAVTFAYQLLAQPAAVARGYEGIVRYDPTGSVVMHSSLSLIFLVLAATRLGQPLRPAARLGTAALGGMALAMLLLSATRTTLVTGAVFALLLLASSPERHRTARGLVLAGVGLALAFLAWTLLVSDSFWLRLTGGQEDFSSGRWSSVRHWLQLAGEHPFGLGLGAVRALLADGRPALDGTALLEWPHNELVRFYVEAGPPGLLFVVLLLGLLVRRAVRAARREADPVRRALMLVIAADLVAEACLQNLLNAIYHATVLVLVLSLAIETTRGSSAWTSDDAGALLGESKREAA
jgi:O-antigen ligase